MNNERFIFYNQKEMNSNNNKKGIEFLNINGKFL